jgi:hypothetical protein
LTGHETVEQREDGRWRSDETPEVEDYVNGGEHRANATILSVGMAVNL